MKTRHTNKWMRRAASVIAVLVLMMSSAGQASARVIIFQDDILHDIDSEGILLNADDGGDEDVTLQFGNDASDAVITFDDGLSDLIYSGAGMDWSAVDQFRIRENADPEANSGCDFLGELIYDTTDDQLQICTTVGVGVLAAWSPVDTTGGTTTLQSAYNAEGANDREILVTAGDNEPVEIRAAAAGNDLLELHANDNSVLIGFNDLAGTTIDIDSLIVDWDATGTFNLDATDDITIGLAADGAGEDITIQQTGANDSSLILTSAGTGADAVKIEASNAAGDIDIDAGDSITMDSNGLIAMDSDDGSITIVTSDTSAADDDSIILTSGAAAPDAGEDGNDVAIETEDAFLVESTGNIDFDIGGTGAFTLDTTDGSVTINAVGGANGDVIIGAGDDLTLDSVGLLELNSSGGVINIGNDDVDQAINVGTTGERTITIGNTTGATALDFNANGAIGVNSDDGSVTIGADDTDNAGNDNVVLLSGNAAPDAGENGNDIALEAEDDVLIEATDAVDIDAASMDVTTSGQFAINTSAWDITGAGAASGFTTITASGDITTSGGDFIVGTTGLSETTAPNDSGAFLVGANDEFDNSASTNVQDVLDDLDALIGVNAPEVETLRFYPEFPDTIYDITATHKGTLESIEDAAEGNAYYWHSKANPGDMVMTLRMRMELPADFDDPNDLTLRYDTTDAVVANNYVGLELYNLTDATSCGTTANSASAAWATLTLNEAGIEGGCNVGGGDALDAGDLIEIRITMMNDNGNSGEAYVGYVDLSYDN